MKSRTQKKKKKKEERGIGDFSFPFFVSAQLESEPDY